MSTEKRFDKLEEKLDKISDDLAEIKVVQAEQAKDLKYHIKRTDLAEERISTVEEKIFPLIEQKNRLDGAFKVIGIIASIATFVLGVAKLIFG
jgi:hypothetical protein